MAKLIALTTLVHHSLGMQGKCRHRARTGLDVRAFLFGVILLGGLLATPQLEAQTSKTVTKMQTSRAYAPVFPYDALIEGRSGWAEISFTVDVSGRVILPSTEGASERDFAQAWQAELEAVEFIPPRRNGKAQMTMARERFDFPATPALDPIALEILTELKKGTPALTPVDALDAKPEALRQPAPAYPTILRGDAISGEALIEFVIDRNGRPLFPRIVSSSHEEFGWAAATAVLRWKYKPPTKSGTPVDTRTTARIVFDIANAANMW